MDSVVQYLLNQCDDITRLALQKALYYIQGFYYAFYETFIFTDDCQAWIHGPVYRDIYNRYKDCPIEKAEPFDATVFSSGEKAIYDSVIQNFCCYSGKTLEKFTHNETPWLITRGDLPITAPSERIIDKKLIGSFFVSVKEKYRMVTPSDIREYANDMFLNS